MSKGNVTALTAAENQRKGMFITTRKATATGVVLTTNDGGFSLDCNNAFINGSFNGLQQLEIEMFMQKSQNGSYENIGKYNGLFSYDDDNHILFTFSAADGSSNFMGQMQITINQGSRPSLSARVMNMNPSKLIYGVKMNLTLTSVIEGN